MVLIEVALMFLFDVMLVKMVSVLVVLMVVVVMVVVVVVSNTMLFEPVYLDASFERASHPGTC